MILIQTKTPLSNLKPRKTNLKNKKHNRGQSLTRQDYYYIGNTRFEGHCRHAWKNVEKDLVLA
ncbi:MAG: hypothetical protein KBD74_08515, partial [Aeromonas sp.]|nr:hypothetical protein [Aeromonas sp.]